MNQREAFEAWQLDIGRTDPMWLGRGDGGNYGLNDVQAEWEAWQAAWQAALASQWQPIETLPVKQMLESCEMFVVRGFNVEGIATGTYTTDAYAVWLESDCGCCHKFARWKHNFPPTHWMPLPPEPTK